MQPLYYCSVCKAPVMVKDNSPAEATITWNCGHDGTTVIAPRKVTLFGESGMGLTDKLVLAARQFASRVTGCNI